jgi:hypothetical protein
MIRFINSNFIKILTLLQNYNPLIEGDKPMQALDPETLQFKDETNKKWVKEWRREVLKLASRKKG